jgi:hypothetical protein
VEGEEPDTAWRQCHGFAAGDDEDDLATTFGEVFETTTTSSLSLLVLSDDSELELELDLMSIVVFALLLAEGVDLACTAAERGRFLPDPGLLALDSTYNSSLSASLPDGVVSQPLFSSLSLVSAIFAFPLRAPFEIGGFLFNAVVGNVFSLETAVFAFFFCYAVAVFFLFFAGGLLFWVCFCCDAEARFGLREPFSE